ncbi:membrane protein [Microbacterium phage Selwyn23]|uniref:Membrane protein n=2 Tax=Quhwahvirus kaihaidragon TaxID=2283289 RepID=A0A8F3ECX7_9CAUD|nr:membrane protein [Microbacterium phage Selwyn23]
MMYSGLPDPERRAVKASLIVGWLSATGAGLSAALFPTSVVLLGMGGVIAISMGITLTISALLAVYGVTFNRYRFEWVAGWLSAACFVPYSITIWSLTITANTHWLTASFISTVALSFFVSRALLCAAHAAKLRIAHEASEVITSAIESVREEGEHGGDAGATVRND